jgi:hypothetical protein
MVAGGIRETDPRNDELESIENPPPRTATWFLAHGSSLTDLCKNYKLSFVGSGNLSFPNSSYRPTGLATIVGPL